MKTTNYITATLIEFDADRGDHTININSYEYCLGEIQARMESGDNNLDEWYFSTPTHTITLDHESKTVCVEEK